MVGHVTGGRGSLPKEQDIRRMKHSPGSGVLSALLVPDGPTRILRVVDENKKVLYEISLPQGIAKLTLSSYAQF